MILFLNLFTRAHTADVIVFAGKQAVSPKESAANSEFVQMLAD